MGFNRQSKSNGAITIEINWGIEKQLRVVIEDERVSSKLLVDKPCLWIPRNIYPDMISIKNIESFIKSRIPNENRDDTIEILNVYGICEYDIYKLCKNTQGRSLNDKLWIDISIDNN